jgi:hypothetical protein
MAMEMVGRGSGAVIASMSRPNHERSGVLRPRFGCERVKPSVEILAPGSLGHPEGSLLEPRSLADCYGDCLLGK